MYAITLSNACPGQSFEWRVLSPWHPAFFVALTYSCNLLSSFLAPALTRREDRPRPHTLLCLCSTCPACHLVPVRHSFNLSPLLCASRAPRQDAAHKPSLLAVCSPWDSSACTCPLMSLQEHLCADVCPSAGLPAERSATPNAPSCA